MTGQIPTLCVLIFSIGMLFSNSMYGADSPDSNRTEGDQEQGIVRGIVLEAGSSRRVAQVNVTNQRTRIAVATNLRGEFSLEARISDSLIFTKIGYRTTKTELQTLSDILVDIRPASVLLETVTIERKSQQEELRDVMESYRRDGVYSGGKPSVLGYVFQPLTSLHERFSRSGRQARRFQRYMENETRALSIDRIFSKYRITTLTGLSGDDLENFARLYRPDFSVAQYWNEYDVTHYIMESFRKFDADGRPQAPTLPRIPIPPQHK